MFVNNILQNQLVDYTIELGINSDDEVATVLRFTRELDESDNVIIKQYSNLDNSFIAPTPASMGLTKVYVPEIYLDTTYVTPSLLYKDTTVVLLHVTVLMVMTLEI